MSLAQVSRRFCLLGDVRSKLDLPRVCVPAVFESDTNSPVGSQASCGVVVHFERDKQALVPSRELAREKRDRRKIFRPTQSLPRNLPRAPKKERLVAR